MHIHKASDFMALGVKENPSGKFLFSSFMINDSMVELYFLITFITQV